FRIVGGPGIRPSAQRDKDCERDGNGRLHVATPLRTGRARGLWIKCTRHDGLVLVVGTPSRLNERHAPRTAGGQDAAQGTPEVGPPVPLPGQEGRLAGVTGEVL